MIFIGLAFIFVLAVPLPNVFSKLIGKVAISIIQVIISGAIVITWLYIMWKLRNFYVKRKILNISKD